MKRLVCFLSFFLFLLLSLRATPSFSMDGRITPLITDNSAVQVTVRADTSFDHRLEGIIFNGIPVRFIFAIKLYRHTPYWFDKELATLTLNHALTYDNLKDVFIIEYSTTNSAPAEVDNLKDAAALVSSIENLTITTQEVLDSKKKYYITYTVDVVADTENSHLPFYLDFLLKIFPWWDKKKES